MKKDDDMAHDGSMKGKTALISGAGSGMGKAAALLLAEQGADVAALEQDGEKLQQVEDELRAFDVDVTAINADIAKAGDMKDAADRIRQKWGRLSILFANAGINGVWAPIEELAPEEFQRTIDSNLVGTFLTIKYMTPLLKKEGGSIIITSSVNGTRKYTSAGATAYSASKAGVVAMMKMLALELASDKIRINAICPGAVKTNLGERTEKRDTGDIIPDVEFPEGKIPLTTGRPAESRDIARLVSFLASDESRHITGTEIWVDGAQSLLQG
jgi:NAD(P)-dependent dehydrogenase (short-subunit alcohol dehydrogenase family)